MMMTVNLWSAENVHWEAVLFAYAGLSLCQTINKGTHSETKGKKKDRKKDKKTERWMMVLSLI